MPKFQKFFKEITTLRSELRGINTLLAKAVIGDSVKNNRTITVNQTIRFLNVVGQVKLAKQLEAVYDALKPFISTARVETLRTDAVDLEELVAIYRQVVMNERLNRQEIGQLISKVG